MTKVPPELLKNITQERLATRDELQGMQWDISKQILQDFVHSPIKKHENITNKSMVSISKYILSFPKRKQREYNPDLETVWDSMESHVLQKNWIGASKDADYILENYKNLLSFDDMFTLSMLFVTKNTGKKHLKNAMTILEHIQQYEKSFTHLQRKSFFYTLGIVYFYLAAGHDEVFYKKALSCFDQVDDEKYLDIITTKIYIFYGIKDYENCLFSIEKFLLLSEGLDSIDTNIKMKRMDAFIIQGFIYEKKRKYKEAIKSFVSYLKYDPNNENVKGHIRMLSEKGEE